MKLIPHRHTEVYTVTNAPKPMSEDIRYRQRRYLISMGVRTGCFVTAVVSAMAGAPLWVVGLLIIGALLLPYLSVIYANGGREPQPQAKFAEPDEGDSSHHKGISGQRPEIGS